MTVRLATQQPFISPDIYNAPRAIDSDCSLPAANLTPAGSQAIRGSPIGMCMDPSQPPTDIQLQATPTQGQTNCAGNGTVKATVPMDPNFVVPSPSSDNLGIGAVIAGTSLKYYQGAQLARCNPGGIATVGKLDGGAQSLLGTSLVGDTGASHMSIIGGVLRIGELVPGGVIAHGLQLILQSRDLYNNIDRSKTFRFPATTSDGYYHVAQKPGGMVYLGTNPKLVMGVGLCLPTSFNIGALRTAPGKILATCFMNYISYCTNTIGGSNTICVEVSGHGVGSYRPGDSPPTGDVRQEFITVWPSSIHGGSFDQNHSGSPTPWALDCIDMFAAFRIVDSLTGPGTGTSYARVLAGYTSSGVGSAGAGNLTGGAPLVAFPFDINSSTGSGTVARTGAGVQTPNPVTAAGATASLTKTLVVGEELVIYIDSYSTGPGRTVLSVADGTSGGGLNTYSHVAPNDVDSSHLHSETWLCKQIVTGGSQTILVTMSDALGQTTVSAVEVSGQDTTGPGYDVLATPGTNNTANPASGASAATAQAGEFAIGHVAVHATTGAPSAPVWGSAVTGQTVETLANAGTPQGIQGYTVDGTQTAAAAQSLSVTAAANAWTATVLVIKPASTVGPICGAPTDLLVRGTGTAGQLAVTLALPVVVGDGITSTVITYYTFSGGVWTAAGTSTITGTGTSKTITALTTGTPYAISAHCVNDAGAGPETAMVGPIGIPSSSAQAPPTPTVAPLIDSVGITDAVADWGPQPPIMGTQLITAYSLRITIVGGGVAATFTVNDTGGPGNTPSLAFDATGLSTDIPYTAAYAATNSVGTSAFSPESAPFVPTSPEGPQQVVTTDYPPAAHPAISARYAALLEEIGN